ncbi:hypothetical protein SLS62_004808 [Diatrype stigma]|uniref:2EXR domain-containing protein n=1 Tax=Diatrype stigma TaxID=117547 RepID=A0AAN9YT39_9PEZI
MAKQEGEHPHHDDVNYVDADDASDDDDNRSSDSGSESDESEQPALFPQFASLPPELRAQIWRAAVDTTAAGGSAPGINFFNVHAFPGDHAGANRSTSPPWLYLDVRRLAIEHSDAEAARYDPSVWQARAAVAATCREARDAARQAVPEDKRILVTLTRPRRGLFVRAGDGQLRRRVPPVAGHGDDGDSGNGFIYREPKVTRKIIVHADEILCLSLENCSFNLPCEENSDSEPPSPWLAPAPAPDNRLMTLAAEGATAAHLESETGWTYDPQLTPFPSSAGGRILPSHQYCLSLARDDADALSVVEGIVPGMLEEVREDCHCRTCSRHDGEDASGHESQAEDGDDNEPTSATTTGSGSSPSPSSPPPPPSDRSSRRPRDNWLIMVDARVENLGSRSLSELLAETRAGLAGMRAKCWHPPPPMVYRDRFDDAYVLVPYTGLSGNERFWPYYLTKVAPERTDVRVRYLQSAQLRSPKRPVASVLS